MDIWTLKRVRAAQYGASGTASVFRLDLIDSALPVAREILLQGGADKSLQVVNRF